MPWFDTAKSDFLSAFEHFWNHWASARKDVMLIICGSSASWIINKLINNTGGLHNRVTQKIKLEPFTLHETEQFLISKKIKWSQYQIVEAYMAFGGIPFYLNAIRKRLSVTQSIDELFFNKEGLLRNEFDNLYKSLFRFADNYMAVVHALSKKTKRLTREEIIPFINYNQSYSGCCQGETLIKSFLSSLQMTKVPFNCRVSLSLSKTVAKNKPAFDRLKLTL